MKKQSLQDSDSTVERPADHDNGRVIRAFGQEAQVLVSSEQTGDAFCLLRFFIPPGNVTPPHLHRATDATFLIESGEIEIIAAKSCSMEEEVTPSIFPKEFPMR